MISWGAVVLSMAVNMASGPVPVRRVVETPEAVYFEPTAPDKQSIVWVFPKTKTVLTRYALDPTFLQADRVLRDVQLPTDLSALEPRWKGKRALFYQVTSQSECALKRRPEMRFVQQWVMAKDVTIDGTKRSAICSFTFKLRPETPELIQQLEREAEVGTLIEHVFNLPLSVTSTDPVRWELLYAGLRSSGVEAGIPQSTSLAAFELGLLRELSVLQSQPQEEQQFFLEAALQSLFGWDLESVEVQLSTAAPVGQYEFPSVLNVISL